MGFNEEPVREIGHKRNRDLAPLRVALPEVFRPDVAKNGVAPLAIVVLEMIRDPRSAVRDGIIATMPVGPDVDAAIRSRAI